ncbi:MAG: hypothetical protein P8Y13_16900 [Deinococcales bacterium]|jgi:hypothetical protein
MEPATASLCTSVAERLKPLYRALRNARLDGEDAFWVVYDEAVIQVSKARNDSEINTKSLARDELQVIMNLVMT